MIEKVFVHQKTMTDKYKICFEITNVFKKGFKEHIVLPESKTHLFRTLHTISCIWHNFHEENLLFSQGTHSHSDMHTDSSHGQTPVTQFYNQQSEL